MIRSFSCDLTLDLFKGRAVAKFAGIDRRARRRLLRLHAASEFSSIWTGTGMAVPAFRGTFSQPCKLPIDESWTLHFEWRPDGAYGVVIVECSPG